MGPTFPAKVVDNMALLSYEGVNFVFKYLNEVSDVFNENVLAKVVIKAEVGTLTVTDRRVRILLDEGLEIYYASDPSKDSTLLLFGDHKMDILRILGNANKEYYQDENLFLNYTELGFDIMIAPDNRVSKFILHTNFPYHPHFGFYDRCFYELDFNHPNMSPKCNIPSVFEEIKEHREERSKKQKKKDKIAKAKLAIAKKEITPLTKFEDIKLAMNEESS